MNKTRLAAPLRLDWKPSRRSCCLAPGVRWARSSLPTENMEKKPDPVKTTWKKHGKNMEKSKPSQIHWISQKKLSLVAWGPGGCNSRFNWAQVNQGQPVSPLCFRPQAAGTHRFSSTGAEGAGDLRSHSAPHFHRNLSAEAHEKIREIDHQKYVLRKGEGSDVCGILFFKQRQPFESWWILLPCFVHNQFQWCPVPLVFFSRPHLSQLRQQIGVSSFNTPGRQLVGPSWKTYAASAPRFKDEDGDGNAWTVGLRYQDIYFRVYSLYLYIYIIHTYLTIMCGKWSEVG